MLWRLRSQRVIIIILLLLLLAIHLEQRSLSNPNPKHHSPNTVLNKCVIIHTATSHNYTDKY